MKKKTLITLLIVLALVGLYLYRNAASTPANAPQQALEAATAAPQAGLALVEDDAPLGEPAKTPPIPVDGEGNEILPDDDPWSTPENPTAPPEDDAEETPAPIDEHGAYTKKDDIALYLHTYGRLPENFMTKKEAEALGWSGGGLDDYAYGMCIGGDRFGNYEGLLPEKKGRRYTECDVNTLHKSSRGAKRIIFSSDGLIYYTGDHYESFTLLYGEE